MNQSTIQAYQAAQHDTGKKWAGDGTTPILRKTVPVTALPNNTTGTTAHGLTAGSSAGNMDLTKHGRVVEINAQDPNSGVGLSISELHVNITGASIIGDNISITTDANLSAYDQVYVTIEYCIVY